MRFKANMRRFTKIFITTVLLFSVTECMTKYSNVALHKTAYQTDTYVDGSVASAAVDGDKSQTWTTHGTCSHTASEQASWEVNLGQLYDIDEVTIYNRWDSSSERLQEVEIYVGRSREQYKLKAYQPGLAGSTLTLPLPGLVIGRWLKITRRIPNGALTLCEVEVMGREVHSKFKTRIRHVASGTAIETKTAYSQQHCAYLCVIYRDCEVALYNMATGSCAMLVSASLVPSENVNDVYLELL